MTTTKLIACFFEDSDSDRAQTVLRTVDDGLNIRGSADALVDAIFDLSACGDQGTVSVGPLQLSTSPQVATTGAYASVEDRAVFLWVTEAGQCIKHAVPGPLSALFEDDDTTIDFDNADVLDYVAKMVVAGRAPGGVSFAECRRGYRAKIPEKL